MNNEEKAKMYDVYIRQHDEKARQVSLIRSKFDLNKDDEKEISKLTEEMDAIQRKAYGLGDYHG